jgi:hypothetical protein
MLPVTSTLRNDPSARPRRAAADAWCLKYVERKLTRRQGKLTSPYRWSCPYRGNTRTTAFSGSRSVWMEPRRGQAAQVRVSVLG